MKLKKLKSLFLTLILLSMSVSANAQSVDSIKLMTEEYPPYNFMKDGQSQGISVDLMEEMLKKMGSKKTRKDMPVLPWARSYKMVLKEKNTALFLMTRTSEREASFKWVGPIIDLSIVLTAKKSKNIKISNDSDIMKYKIGTVRDDVGEQLLLGKGISKGKLDRVSKAKSNIKKLKSGKIDLISYDEAVTKWVLKSIGANIGDYEAVYTLQKGAGFYAFHKDTPDSIIKQFQEALDKVKASGKYKQITDKYLK